MKRSLISVVATVFGLLPCVPAMGTEGGSGAQTAKSQVYQMWNVDSMIRQAAENVSRRYNLSPQQAEYTRKMMEERVTRFLEEKEEAIWPLIRDLARQQLTGKPFDPFDPEALATAKRIGESALPIVEEAKKAIYEANAEWGEILSEEQRQLHDYDLREMKGQFEEIRQNFENYKTGKPQTNSPIFPTHNPKADEPPRPPKPSDVYKPRTLKMEDRWDKYVRDFIRKYELDPAQQGSANSTLRELKERAASYREAKAQQYEAVAKRLKEAINAGDLKKRAKTSRDERALNKPIEGMFTDLKRRLDKIPTTAQKKKYQETVKAKRAKRHPPADSKAKTPKRKTGTGN